MNNMVPNEEPISSFYAKAALYFSLLCVLLLCCVLSYVKVHSLVKPLAGAYLTLKKSSFWLMPMICLMSARTSECDRGFPYH